MHLLISLALIVSLLFLAALGVSNIERDLIRQPRGPMRGDDELMD